MTGIILPLLIPVALEFFSNFFLMSSKWNGVFVLQFFVQGKNSAKSSLPGDQYVWDWSNAQALEATSEEKEMALSRYLKERLSTITKAQELLFLVS